MSYLTSVDVHLPDGIADFALTFDKGVNFLSGENGTGKSKTLEFIKISAVGGSGEAVTNDSKPIGGETIAFYNPKRNSQKKEVTGLIEQLQREGKSARTLRSLVNQNYSDQQFVEYPSVAELYALSVDDISKSKDLSPSEAVTITLDAMKLVLGKVMPQIEVDAQWNTATNQATLTLMKFGRPLRPPQLSVGENEIIALALSIYLFREAHSVYLIDEPEVHLNWSLEQKLFEFLRWFAEKEGKQVIVATHSAIVFEKEFKDRTQFFSWQNDRVVVTQEPSEALTNKLARRVAATFQAIETQYDKTFFVEDDAHQLAVERIADIRGKNVNVIQLRSRANVIALQKALGTDMSDGVFMVDGDNDDVINSTFTGQLFALQKYCIENYFLVPEVLAKLSKRPAYNTVAKVKKLIIDKTQSYSNAAFKRRYKANIIVAGSSKKEFWGLLDSMDGSCYLNGMKLWQQLGYGNKKAFMEAYIAKCEELKKLDSVFGEITSKL